MLVELLHLILVEQEARSSAKIEDGARKWKNKMKNNEIIIVIVKVRFVQKKMCVIVTQTSRREQIRQMG